MKKLILALVGLASGGKSELSEAIVALLGSKAETFSSSELLQKQKPNGTRTELHQLSVRLRRQRGYNYIAKHLIRQTLQSKAEVVILDSFRSVPELVYVIEHLTSQDCDVVVVACDDTLVNRFQNAKRRDESKDPPSAATFIEEELREAFGAFKEFRTSACFPLAEIHVKRPPIEKEHSSSNPYRKIALEVVSTARLIASGGERGSHRSLLLSAPRTVHSEYVSRSPGILVPYPYLVSGCKIGSLKSGGSFDRATRAPTTVQETQLALAVANVRAASSRYCAQLLELFDGKPDQPIVFVGSGTRYALCDTDGTLRHLSRHDKLPKRFWVACLTPWR